MQKYSYIQSDQQAFFFINSATIRGESLEEDDIVIAYNGDVIVGSRYWNGELTDVPAIGVDTQGGQIYAGYCEYGDQVTFKVLDASTGNLIDMNVSGNNTWEEMQMNVVSLTDHFVPTEVSFGSAYPNPFNPVTMLTYDVPAEMNIHLGVYDLRGRLVDELVSDVRDQGQYEVTWNADVHSSGVYMIKLVAGSTVKVQ